MSVIGTMKILGKDFLTAGKEYILSKLTWKRWIDTIWWRKRYVCKFEKVLETKRTARSEAVKCWIIFLFLVLRFPSKERQKTKKRWKGYRVCSEKRRTPKAWERLDAIGKEISKSWKSKSCQTELAINLRVPEIKTRCNKEKRRWRKKRFFDVEDFPLSFRCPSERIAKALKGIKKKEDAGKEGLKFKFSAALNLLGQTFYSPNFR